MSMTLPDQTNPKNDEPRPNEDVSSSQTKDPLPKAEAANIGSSDQNKESNAESSNQESMGNKAPESKVIKQSGSNQNAVSSIQENRPLLNRNTSGALNKISPDNQTDAKISIDPIPHKTEPEKRRTITLDPDSYIYCIVFSQGFWKLSFLPFKLFQWVYGWARPPLTSYVKNLKKILNKKGDCWVICLILAPFLLLIYFSGVILIIMITLALNSILIAFLLIPFLILAIPSIFVPFLQISSVAFLTIPDFPQDAVSSCELSFSMAKILISIINILQCSNEAIQAVKNILYAYDRCVKDQPQTHFSNMGFFFPGLIQLSLTLVIEYFSMNIIFTSENALALITNFAGLYVILEFDEIVIKFLKSTNLIRGIVILVEFFSDIMVDQFENVFNANEMLLILSEIRDKDELEIEEEPKNKFLFDRQNLYHFFVMLIIILNAFFPHLKMNVFKW